MTIDLLLTGATVCPVGAPEIPNGAVAIRGGRIVAVGAATQVEALIGPATRRIQLEPQQAIIPGFNDSHQHIFSYVRSRSRLSLWDTTRLDDLLGRIRSAAECQPPGTWIVAVGHDQGRLIENRNPLLSELDAIAPEHPLLVIRACSHIGLANSRALSAAGIDITTPDPVGGRFERSDGRLTGVLQESALAMVSRAIIAPPIDWESGLLAAGREYHRRGITAIGEAALGHVEGLRDLERLQYALEYGLDLRVYAMAYGSVAEQLLAQAEAQGRDINAEMLRVAQHDNSPESLVTYRSDWLRFGCIKYFIDGTLGGGTAFLTEDYGDQPGNRGWPIMPVAELEQQVERAHRAGFQVAVHAIGDAAVAMVTDVYERVLARYPRANHRHRIEHVEVVHAGLPERMARLGIVAGIQSCFTYWEAGDVTRLGPGLAPYGHAWGDLLRAGVPLANGSDNPVLPDFQPVQGLSAAVTRRTYNGLALTPEQAIRPVDALHSYTRGAAYASFDEQRMGSITPGMLADLAILSGNPLGPDPEALHELQVDMTIVDGRIVFER
jgi:predicted amidohydrolase YtcJ